MRTTVIYPPKEPLFSGISADYSFTATFMHRHSQEHVVRLYIRS